MDAVDAAGNVSNDSPSAQARTLDTVSPTWTEGATLNASEISANGLKLSWPMAQDDVRVEIYSLYQDGELLAVLPNEVTMYHLADLAPWTMYVFEVKAALPSNGASTH